MRSARAILLVMAAGVSLLAPGSALACVIPIHIPWFCEDEPTYYAPMRVPAQDPKAGPVWTSNGWAYPDVRLSADAPPPSPYGPPFADAREALEPGPEAPRPLK